MSRAIKGGSVDQSTVIRFVDSTDGTPENGVVAATAGLALWYRREGGLRVLLGALNDLATLDAAYNENGILLIGDGYYRLDLPDAAFAVGSTGVLVGGTATGTVVIAAYHPIDQAVCDELLAGHTDAGSVGEALARLDDIQNKTDLIGTASYSVASPVMPSGNINLTQGDSYFDADSRSLEFPNADGTWAGGDLTDATILFTVRRLRDKVAVISKAGSVVTPTGSQKVRVELASAETGVLQIDGGGNYEFQVRATLPITEHRETIWEGAVNVTVQFA